MLSRMPPGGGFRALGGSGGSEAPKCSPEGLLDTVFELLAALEAPRLKNAPQKSSGRLKNATQGVSASCQPLWACLSEVPWEDEMGLERRTCRPKCLSKVPWEGPKGGRTLQLSTKVPLGGSLGRSEGPRPSDWTRTPKRHPRSKFLRPLSDPPDSPKWTKMREGRAYSRGRAVGQTTFPETYQTRPGDSIVGCTHSRAFRPVAAATPRNRRE